MLAVMLVCIPWKVHIRQKHLLWGSCVILYLRYVCCIDVDIASDVY